MSEENAAAMTQYWYNTATGEVEEGHRSGWTHLMGPYATREEAQAALDKARARSEAWDADDDRWRRG
ncbi:SPOR domain-containing protein [Puerhibacterium puerhi]|uniref:SPOR domain-containing protein n=1 Tax=Puerhibacterium puerhi TaxID=2692623 RepID=UPI0038B65607